LLTCGIGQALRSESAEAGWLHEETGRDGLPPYRLVAIEIADGHEAAGRFESLARHIHHTWSRWHHQERCLEELSDVFRMADALCDLSSQVVTPAEVARQIEEGLAQNCHVQSWLILLNRGSELCAVASPSLKIACDAATVRAQIETLEKVRIGDLVFLGHDDETARQSLAAALAWPPHGEIVLLPLDKPKAQRKANHPPAQWLFGLFDPGFHPPGPVLDRMRVFCHLGLAAWEVARRAEEAKERERYVQEREILLKQSIRALPGFDAIIGESPVMEEFRSAILRAAKSDRTVLLIGEQGTGKEMAAKLIHRHSEQGAFGFICRRVAAELASGLELWKSFHPSAKRLDEIVAKEFRDVPFVRVADFSKDYGGWKPKDSDLEQAIEAEECRLLPQHRYLYRCVLRRLYSAWQQDSFFNFFEYDSGAAATQQIATELFGFPDKRFTDAEGGPGRFQTASHCGGTLFLDNIHHLDLSVQKALLKATEVRHEDRRVTRAGAAGSEPVHVRIIAATTTDLRELTADKRFIYELVSRLMCEVILIPPLNDRREDIRLLAAHFAQRQGKAIEVGAIEPLRSVDWHGVNVRGLQNIIESAAQTDGSVITANEIDRAVRLHCSQVVKVPMNSEQIMIREAMERAGGNIQRAAEAIGWSRQKLYRLLDHYGIDRRDFLRRRKC
jgi:DNA-binding NtrC family response regulator